MSNFTNDKTHCEQESVLWNKEQWKQWLVTQQPHVCGVLTCWLKRCRTVVIVRDTVEQLRQNVSISKYKEIRSIVRSTLVVFKYRFTMKHSQWYESIALLLLSLELHSLFENQHDDGCFEVIYLAVSLNSVWFSLYCYLAQIKCILLLNSSLSRYAAWKPQHLRVCWRKSKFKSRLQLLCARYLAA